MSAPALTLESLQLVDAIARRGSFAGAASELGRVPSAVTYAVRRLEEDLDVLLFDRGGYRARLTPAGEELLREGRHLLAAADDPEPLPAFRAACRGESNATRNRIEAAVPESSAGPGGRRGDRRGVGRSDSRHVRRRDGRRGAR